MKTFSNIRFKKKTTQRFQEFSRRFFKTHTEALETMLDFFFYNEISPKETIGPNIRTLETSIKRRINSLIAIIKDIEKHQTQPTTAMLQLLFEQTPQKKQQSTLVERKTSTTKKEDEFFKSAMEAIELQKENTNLKRDLRQTYEEFQKILNKVHIIRSSFGKSKLQLDMSIDDFSTLRSKIEKF